MARIAGWIKGLTVTAIVAIAGNAPAVAATFVYVSNAEDGDIGTYRLLDSGELEPGARTQAAKVVMPMAVSPDRRFLYAASRSKPFTVHTYAIDLGTGALKPLSTAPLAEAFRTSRSTGKGASCSVPPTGAIWSASTRSAPTDAWPPSPCR